MHSIEGEIPNVGSLNPPGGKDTAHAKAGATLSTSASMVHILGLGLD